VALTPILRKHRVPVAVLSLSIFVGLLILTTTDAGAYWDGLPAKQFEHNSACDGDPDLPSGFTGGHGTETALEAAGMIRLIVEVLLSSGVLGG
jgi:hypothetical protein